MLSQELDWTLTNTHCEAKHLPIHNCELPRVADAQTPNGAP